VKPRAGFLATAADSAIARVFIVGGEPLCAPLCLSLGHR
jgi:hypothetical protein